MAAWVPIIARIDPKVLGAYVPVINGLHTNVVEAFANALPFLNVSSVISLLPAVNAIPERSLETLIRVLGQVGSLWVTVERHVPGGTHSDCMSKPLAELYSQCPEPLLLCISRHNAAGPQLQGFGLIGGIVPPL